MSANTPEGRAEETRQAIEAIQDVLRIDAGMAPETTYDLAWAIYNAEPMRCDFDCGNCRD